MRRMLKATAALVSAIALVMVPACRIPADKTTPGAPAVSTPSVTSIVVTQTFALNVPPTVSNVMIEHKGATVFEQPLLPPAGTPAPSPSSLQTGEISPGQYTINIDDLPCGATGCTAPTGTKFKADCSITVIVAKDEAVTAMVRVTKKSCTIEVG
jgi:hypothetical protein